MRLGVMGGTFDPVHIGHLVIAEEARDRFDLEKVLFIPSARPPHKGGLSYSSPADRLEMVKLAIKENPYLEASDVEIEREGLSFAIDTINDLHGKYGRTSELFFITGTDAIIEIPSWKDCEQLLLECRFIVATRPGYSLKETQDLLARSGCGGQGAKDRIIQMESPGLEISSTSIRERVEQGRPFRYLLPDAVWRYIRENGLYV